MTENQPIKILPIEYSTIVFQASWKVLKRNYLVLLLGTLVLLLIAGGLSNVPYLGAILGAVAGTMLGKGWWEVAKKSTHGENCKFEEIFLGLKDKEFFMRMLPFMGASVVIGLVNQGLVYLSLSNGGAIGLLISLASLVLGFGWMILTFFSFPLMLFKNMSFQDSIERSFSAFFKNLGAIIVFILLNIVVGILSIVLLVLPFFLVFLPILMLNSYVFYAAVFEDLAAENVQ